MEALLQLTAPADVQIREALAAELAEWRQNWRAAIPTLTLRCCLALICSKVFQAKIEAVFTRISAVQAASTNGPSMMSP